MSFSRDSTPNIIGLAKAAAPELGQILRNRRRGILLRTRNELGYSQERMACELTVRGVPCCRKTIQRYEDPRGTSIPADVADVAEAMLLAERERRTGS